MMIPSQEKPLPVKCNQKRVQYYDSNTLSLDSQMLLNGVNGQQLLYRFRTLLVRVFQENFGSKSKWNGCRRGFLLSEEHFEKLYAFSRQRYHSQVYFKNMKEI